MPASIAAFADMRDVIDRMQEAQEQSIAASFERVETVKAQAVAAGELAQTKVKTATQVFLALGALGFLVMVTLLVKSGRSMASALGRALSFAKGITHGDLNQALDVQRNDEFGDLAKALDEMQTSMRDSMENIERAREADRQKTAELERAQVQQNEQARKLETASQEQAQANAERIAMAEREAAQLQALEAQVDAILSVIETAVSGDLTAHLDVHGDEAIDRVGKGVSELLVELRSNFKSIADSAEVLNNSSSELTGLSTGLNDRAEDTASEADDMARIASEVSASIETVAAAAEEMEASIREISTQTTLGARIAGQAVDRANTAGETMGLLDAATGEIRDIIKVITAIAEQTNLLALNATIEAARAGEAGKGFAVVANEVKDLAQATALATKDIADRIDAVQTSSGAAIEAISEISEVIRSINDIQGSIASAIEEQTATTGEIVRSLAGAAQGSLDIATRSGGLAETSKATLADVARSRESASNLSSLAGNLTGLVSRYHL